MYYILNETNQIIAADDHLLGLCAVSNINELSSILALGDITFDLSETSLSIHIDNSDNMFSISKTSLSSMLGHLTLVELASEEENDLAELPIDDAIEELTPEELAPLDLGSDLISILSDSDEDKDTVQDEMSIETALSLTDDDFMGIKEEVSEVLETAETFDLDLSSQDDLFGAEEDNAEIPIDIETISQQIGISQEDYNLFLNEYIDAAINLEEDLQCDEAEKRSNAIETLSHLGEVLRLPVIGEVIENIASASADTQKTMIASFYGTLSRLTTQTSSQEEAPQEEVSMELLDTVTLTEEPELFVDDTASEPVVNENSFGTINLDDVKPIHFDFQLEEAANDLSLPVELIEEFVNDFIDQGRIETKKMLEAYEEGDLDAIQKIGHLLKGTSSNLRINALSDTLYKIQFCEDSSTLEALIKDYWGHFLSFEIQINAISR